MPVQPRPSLLQIQPYKGGLSKAGTKRVIKLSSNETPLGPSPKAIEAYKAAGEKLYRYPDGSAIGLREAIGKVYGINPEKIVCGAGSDEIISLLCQAYLNPGDEVIYTEHGFLMYKISTLAAGGVPVSVPEKNLHTDVDAILKGVTVKTKIVFLANPNNPTGTYISSKEMARLRKELRNDILLVIDGAYAEYVQESDYSTGQELVESTDNTVMTRTFSKIYGLPALRVGWGHCPADVADMLNRERGPFNVATPAMEAAIAAVLDTAFTDHARQYNAREREWLHGQLQSLGLEPIPSVGNFILVRFPSAQDANKTFEHLMSNGIIVRPVENYGLPEYLRITIGTTEDNREVMQCLSGR